MTELGLLLGLVALAFCFLEWRQGVLIAVAIGFLADPVRKLIPGEPVVLTVAVGAFALASLGGALQHQGWGLAGHLLGRYRGVRAPLQAFFLWVAFAAVRTVLGFGSIIMAGIGIVAYLAPLPGVLLGYYFGSSLSRIKRFSAVYIGGCVAMASGIFLETVGFDWPVLGQVGEIGVVIHGLEEASGGFFRSPEVAAWHAGAAICLLFVLATSVWRTESRPVAVVLIVFLAVAGLMTGRRKMIVQIILFVSLYGLILTYFRREAKRLVALGLIVAFVGALGINEFLERSQDRARFERYIERGASVFESAPERAKKLGLRSMFWAFRRHGVLGSGAGISSQGAQHFGGGMKLGGGGAEGGLGKIVAELGLPGLGLSLWLVFSIVRALWRDLERLARRAPGLVGLAAGLVAFLAAQVPTFAVAAPVYGDPFVLIVLGSILGFVLAISSWTEVPTTGAPVDA